MSHAATPCDLAFSNGKCWECGQGVEHDTAACFGCGQAPPGPVFEAMVTFQQFPVICSMCLAEAAMRVLAVRHPEIAQATPLEGWGAGSPRQIEAARKAAGFPAGPGFPPVERAGMTRGSVVHGPGEIWTLDPTCACDGCVYRRARLAAPEGEGRHRDGALLCECGKPERIIEIPDMGGEHSAGYCAACIARRLGAAVCASCALMHEIRARGCDPAARATELSALAPCLFCGTETHGRAT